MEQVCGANSAALAKEKLGQAPAALDELAWVSLILRFSWLQALRDAFSSVHTGMCMCVCTLCVCLPGEPQF